MQSFAAQAAQGERGYVTIYSIVHYVSGWVWHLLWQWNDTGSTWLSLFLLATLAIVFELGENSQIVSYWIWSKTLGRDGREYEQDSLENSQCDVLAALVGWLVVELIDTSTLNARIAMLCVALVLLVLFVFLFYVRQKRTRVLPTKPAAKTVRFSFAI